ncbi:MAG: hypothetical protein Q7S33_00410 [Nanoarchaeota archaeon]|nr:hypothetical protein [Nanoarchaeota archaeon]
MTCTNCTKNSVWEFTNQTKLCKKCFIDYFERKIFRTIREFHIIKGKSVIYLKKENSLNNNVLKFVLKNKFSIKFSNNPDFSSENLSELAENNFAEILKGNFKLLKSKKQNLFFPLQNASDKEIELYAELNKISGKKRKENKGIRELFERFMKKNQDLEHNIINASEQLEL